MDSAWISQLRQREEQMFGHLLDPRDGTRMLHDGYAWHYRPSHHAARGLVQESDLQKNILSVGAYPAHLEQILAELGASVFVADSDARINELALPHAQFDMTKEWPDIGTFDVILFPESLCIALTDCMKAEGILADKNNPAATDEREAEVLAHILTQALDRLNPQGVIRADGPMSHPNVINRVQEKVPCEIVYERFLMTVQTRK